MCRLPDRSWSQGQASQSCQTASHVPCCKGTIAEFCFANKNVEALTQNNHNKKEGTLRQDVKLRLKSNEKAQQRKKRSKMTEDNTTALYCRGIVVASMNRALLGQRLGRHSAEPNILSPDISRHLRRCEIFDVLISAARCVQRTIYYLREPIASQKRKKKRNHPGQYTRLKPQRPTTHGSTPCFPFLPLISHGEKNMPGKWAPGFCLCCRAEVVPARHRTESRSCQMDPLFPSLIAHFLVKDERARRVKRHYKHGVSLLSGEKLAPPFHIPDQK